MHLDLAALRVLVLLNHDPDLDLVKYAHRHFLALLARHSYCEVVWVELDLLLERHQSLEAKPEPRSVT